MDEQNQPSMQQQMLQFMKQVTNNLDYKLLNQILKEQDVINKKYKKEDVAKWLDNPSNNEASLRKVHLYLLGQSMFYRRIIDYFASILTFDYVLIPMCKNPKDLESTAFQKSYYNTLDFLEKFNIKDQFIRMMKQITGEDVGFYFLREEKDTITMQKMPTDYCKIVDFNNIGYVYAMDMSYFDKNGVNIENYANEVKQAYKLYKNKGDKLQRLENTTAPLFKFNENTAIVTPPFISLYYDIFDLMDFKELIKNKALLDNWKILFQRIPMKNDKDASINNFLIDLDTAGQFHNAIKQNLPQKGVSVVTSPMEVSSVITDKNQSQNSLLEYAETSFYNSVGVSNLLFNSSNSGTIGLSYSVKTDEMFVINLYRQFERWINYQINSRTGKKFTFKVMFPDITYFNRQEKTDSYFKMAQFGFPKSLVACSMGLTPFEFKGLTDFENAMNLVDTLIPLQSSHTGNNASDDVGGRPQKAEGDLSDNGAKTRNNQGNQNRAT